MWREKLLPDSNILESGFWRDVVQKGRKPLSKLYISLCLI